MISRCIAKCFTAVVSLFLLASAPALAASYRVTVLCASALVQVNQSSHKFGQRLSGDPMAKQALKAGVLPDLISAEKDPTRRLSLEELRLQLASTDPLIKSHVWEVQSSEIDNFLARLDADGANYSGRAPSPWSAPLVMPKLVGLTAFGAGILSGDPGLALYGTLLSLFVGSGELFASKLYGPSPQKFFQKSRKESWSLYQASSRRVNEQLLDDALHGKMLFDAFKSFQWEYAGIFKRSAKNLVAALAGKKIKAFNNVWASLQLLKVGNDRMFIIFRTDMDRIYDRPVILPSGEFAGP